MHSVGATGWDIGEGGIADTWLARAIRWVPVAGGAMIGSAVLTSYLSDAVYLGGILVLFLGATAVVVAGLCRVEWWRGRA